jgi:hypothetical protein
MVFGYLVIQRLLVLVRIFSRLPDPVSRVYANILDAATNPFHIINYYGSCAAALLDNRRRMGAKLETLGEADTGNLWSWWRDRGACQEVQCCRFKACEKDAPSPSVRPLIICRRF